MRVFVTGATGFVGSAIVQELIGAGHQVLGLARSDASAQSLREAGAEVHRGTLHDSDSLKRGASGADGVIHAGFIHDFSDFEASCRVDMLAIEALGFELAGSDRPMVVTSGTLGLPPGRVATEEDTPNGNSPRQSESTAFSLLSQSVRVSVIRLPPSVHGDGDHGFVPRLISVARDRGFMAYVGDGENRWPAVHRLDAARLYRVALEQGAAGEKFHGVADEGVPIRTLAEVIGRQLNVPVVSQSPEEVAQLFGFIGHLLAVDAPASSARTQQRLGWLPCQPGLIADLQRGSYFDP